MLFIIILFGAVLLMSFYLILYIIYNYYGMSLVSSYFIILRYLINYIFLNLI